MAAPGQTPTSDSGVAELQRVLKTYAQITGYTPADPGVVDGVIGIKTTMAVIAIVPRVPGLPSEVTAMVPVMALMLAAEDTRTQVFNLIKRNASLITKAIIALEAYRVGTGTGTAPPATTPTSTSIKAGTLWQPGANPYAATTMTATAPMVYTSGGAIPGDPTRAIWFRDAFTRRYRVAVPKQGLHGFADYVEVAPSASPPASGTQVSRTAFMSAIGKWWGTLPGMIALGAVGVGVGFAAYKGARAVI